MGTLVVQRFRQTHKKAPVELYLAAVPVADVIDRHRIDILTRDNPGGYQRAPESSRIRTIARYVIGGEGMLPTALLVNIRHGAWFEPAGTLLGLEGADALGVLHFQDDEPWWVEDGQHRTLGVKEAIEYLTDGKRLTRLNYDFPVVFCLNFSRSDEMDLFEIVNSKAKSVPTDLVASIIFTRVTEERASGEAGQVSLPALRKTAGVAVSHYLEHRQPWVGHIQGVNEPKDVTNMPMQANTFASTLLPLLRERWVHVRFLTRPDDQDFVELCRLVHLYWTVLADLMPDAFRDIAHYSVQRPIGVYAFHELLPEILDACRMEDDYSAESFKNKLLRLEEWVQSATWHRETGADIIKGSGNRAAIRVVVERMRTLYLPLLTGLPAEDAA